MPNPVFYVIGAPFMLFVCGYWRYSVLQVFQITGACVVFVIAAVIIWRCSCGAPGYGGSMPFGGGGMMDRTHLVVLSHLNFDGQGSL